MVDSDAIRVRQLEFGWGKAPALLRLEDFRLGRGERLFLYGPSGSGKTTLLNLLAGVLVPQAGSVELLGQPFSRCNARQRDQMRADYSGFIFQVFNLLPWLSLEENVRLPCQFSASRRQRAIQRHGSEAVAARYLLGELGLAGDVLQRPVAQLSVGQQQRVAAARALIGEPPLIIADEPTSALDSDMRQVFIELLIDQVDRNNSSLLFVSHDHSLKSFFSRSLSLAELNQQEAC